MIGYVVAVNADSGQDRWRFRSEGLEEATAVSARIVTDSTVYGGVSNLRFVSVTACPPEGCSGPPELWPDSHEAGFVVALDATSSEERWRTTTDGSALPSPLLADGTLSVGSGGGVLLALDAERGQPKWRWERTITDSTNVPDAWIGRPAASEGVVYMVSGGTNRRQRHAPRPRRAHWSGAVGGSPPRHLVFRSDGRGRRPLRQLRNSG